MRDRIRVLLPAAFVLLFLMPGSARPAGADPFYDRLRAARAALAGGDLAAAKAGFDTADSTAAGLPSAIWSLAQIAARQGNAEEAIRRLEEYAAMGLARSVARDTTFASLQADPRLSTVAARLIANADPRATATMAAGLDDAGLLAEDIAYDATARTYYVSSIHRRKVVTVDASGVVRDFVPAAQGGIWGVHALALDAAHRVLWGSMAAIPTMEGYAEADSGRTALVCWDLRTGKELARVELARDGAPHVLGDITLAPNGSLYATDSRGGGLYRLRRGATTLETLAPSGTFGSPQLPVLMEKGRVLWLADYPRGIVSYDLRTRTIATVPKPRTLGASGIDGLYAAGEGLIAIQNGTRPIRVLSLTLDPAGRSITGWSVLEQDSPSLGEPNHGVVVGESFYFIGNSGWDRVNGAEQLETPEGAIAPVILRLPLPAAQ